MIALRDLQRQQHEWTRRNFGAKPRKVDWAVLPVLGVGEEVGEFWEAYARDDLPGQVDACADVAIFAMDYASRRGWDAEELVGLGEDTFKSPYARGTIQDIAIFAGRLAHAVLKAQQGVRGTPEAHDGAAREAIGCLLVALDLWSRANAGRGLHAILSQVVPEVTARDWANHPETGAATRGS